MNDHHGGNNRHQHDKENIINNNGCDDIYENIELLKLENELYKETFLVSEENYDAEKVMDIMRKIEKISPPHELDVEKSLQDFYKRLQSNELQKMASKNINISKKRKIKFIIPLVAVLIVILTTSIATFAFRFSLFDMFVDFGEDVKRVIFRQETNPVGGSNAPKNISEEKIQKMIFKSYEDVFRTFRITFPTPNYLPANVQLISIEANKTIDEKYTFEITYTNELAEKVMTIYIRRSSKSANAAKTYESDYEAPEAALILGQQVNIISDEYNKSCDFAYNDLTYTISTSNMLSLSEFKKVVESITNERKD